MAEPLDLKEIVSTEGLTIKTVFVLGAGFTHAFFPKAPLLTDDYAGELLAKFEKLPHARRILELEQSKNPEGKINIERLLTRLDGKMPYDFKSSVQEELALLLSELKLAFLRRLEEAKDEKSHIDELQSLARYCIDKRINCLTFNYDDFFDQSLWDVHKPTFIGPPHKPYWHPDGGYGFFCRPSTDCIMESHSYMDQTAMLLLKLHGSVNWRPKRGAATPYGIDSIVHHETWLDPPVPDSWPHTKTAIETHLEPVPLIVPPVLMKSALTKEPILQVVWSRAYEILSQAERVVFIGYSLPITDIAAGFLFGETLLNRNLSQIQVINYTMGKEDKKRIQEAYKNVFLDISEIQFDFRDALEWVQELLHNKKG